MVESLRNLHIVLFIGIINVVQTMDKICPYSDPKCWCDFSQVRCQDLQEIPPLNTGANVLQVESVHLWDGNITSISKNSLPPGVDTINLVHHPLTNISDDAFEASSATLTYLFIQGADFTRFPSALKKLTKLINLYIEDTPIHDWDTAALKNLAKTLNFIELKNVSLSVWPSWISDFRLLWGINLNGNPLKSVPDDAFKLIKGSLHELSLCGTGLTHVPQALSTLSSLDHLRLCSNSFTDESEFKRITGSPFAKKLRDLNLDATGLTRIPPNFSTLTHLKYISLNNNRIQEIPAGSLPASLKRVDLSYNRLSSVPKDIARMSELESVYLSNNLITVIEPNSLPSQLEGLFLDFNKLTNINKAAFENLSNLRYLYLDSNPISTIAYSAFSGLKKLKSLSINNVHLTKFPLALTELSQETSVKFTSTKPLACPCPASSRLLDWFRSLTDPERMKVSCSSGQTFSAYVKGRCKKP